MANSNTTLPLINQNQASKEITANGLFTAASPSMVGGRNESTSSGLYWGYLEGKMLAGGNISNIASDRILLPANSTCYIEATTAGTVSFNTAGFTSGRVPLYRVITGAATITSWTDERAVALYVKP